MILNVQGISAFNTGTPQILHTQEQAQLKIALECHMAIYVIFIILSSLQGRSINDIGEARLTQGHTALLVWCDWVSGVSVWFPIRFVNIYMCPGWDLD